MLNKYNNRIMRFSLLNSLMINLISDIQTTGTEG